MLGLGDKPGEMMTLDGKPRDEQDAEDPSHGATRKFQLSGGTRGHASLGIEVLDDRFEAIQESPLDAMVLGER
jgi:hypothetical protein